MSPEAHEENHAIVEAARQTFHELGCKSFADPEVNEADAMMEFCLELNLTDPPGCLGSALLPGLRRVLQRSAGHRLLRQCRTYSRDFCAILPESLSCRQPGFLWDCFPLPPMKRRLSPCSPEPRCCWSHAVWSRPRTSGKSSACIA